MVPQCLTITWKPQQQLTHPPELNNQWHLLCTVSVLGSVLSYSAIICTHSPTISTPTSHWKHIIHQRFHIYFKNNSVFLLSLFRCTKPLQGETLSLSSVNVSEWGVWMCWLNVKLAEILIKRYMSLGPGSVSIACRLHYSCSLCLILPLWCTAGFIKLHPKKMCMCIFMYFQQVAAEGQKKSEWAKRKQRLMAFFTQDVKVKTCVGMKDLLFLFVFDYRTTALGLCTIYS